METYSSVRAIVALLFIFASGRASAQTVDSIFFGNSSSETSHALVENRTAVITGGLGQSARQCLPLDPVGVYGGTLTFTVTVDPVRRNYFTVKLWGEDDGNTATGRLYLYVNIGGKDYQVGYRHEGDYLPINAASSKLPLPGRFFYSTSPLPLSLTRGKTSLTLKIVSSGRVYALGSGGPPNGNYQYNMTLNSRGIYAAYTHVSPLFEPSGEVQGVAPATVVRPSPGSEIMNPGGTFFNAVNGRIAGRLAVAASVKSMTTDDVVYLARSYTLPGMVGYNNPAVIAQVIASIDAYATAYHMGTVTPSSGWGGAFGKLGHAIHLLSAELAPSLDMTGKYGAAGGDKVRRVAWGDMLHASREFGRLNRDGRAITNQALIADETIYMANKGLLALGDARAFTEAAAQRYLREAGGMSPWLGSDLAAGGSSLRFGPNYYQVTTKGLTREYGYVGSSYGEMAFHLVDFYKLTGDASFLAQAVKMGKARAPFRRPAIEVNGSSYYNTMEAIGLLAWRGANESDGEFGTAIAYGDSSEWARALHLAAVSLDPELVGYGRQMLADNQFFVSLVRDSRYSSDLNALEAFSDYQILAGTDSPVRLPMTEGQPDFAWADEENGVVALKQGDDRLWISLYWQAKGGTGVNGLGRFHYNTPQFDRIGMIEVVPKFHYSGTFYRRPNLVDKPEQNLYVPPDAPAQLFAGEKLPLAETDLMEPPADPNVASYAPFRGKVEFYTARFGRYLIGMNVSTTASSVLRVPVGFTSARDLVSGITYTGNVTVAPRTTVVLHLPASVDAAPVPGSPLLLEAKGRGNGVSLEWTPASGATTYNVKRSSSVGGPYTTIATGIGGPAYFDATANNGALYNYVVSASNASGEGYDSMENFAQSPWKSQDLGTPTLAGTAVYATPPVTLKGAGLDIGGTGDGLHYSYQDLAGDGTLSARLVSVVNAGALDKRGAMMRQSLQPGSAMATVLIDPTGTARFGYRTTYGGGTTWSVGVSGPATPRWVRLVRAGNVFTGYVSNDGTAWTLVGSATISMTSSISAGFAVCSRAVSTLSTATFDSLTTPKPSAVWYDADIGAATAPGGATYGKPTFTVRATGSDIGVKADSGHFAFQTVSGNTTLIARLASATNAGTSDKRGLMLRESTATNSITAAVIIEASGLARFASRATTGANMVWVPGLSGVTLPQWVKLTREGSTFSGYLSADGVTWTLLGSATITVADTMHAGLIVCSRNAQLATVTFDSITPLLAEASAPAAPTGLTATAGNSVVSLAWTSSASNYQLKRSLTAGGPYTIVAPAVTGTTYVDKGLTNGVTYRYALSALNTVGESADSAEVTATPTNTVPPVPTTLAVSANSTPTQAMLTWRSSPGATSHTVKRATTAGGPYVVLVSGITNTNYNDGSVAAGTTYYYTVSATNGAGESADSASATYVPPAYFTAAVTPATQTVAAGGAATYTFTTTARNGFAGTVDVFVRGAPLGATVSAVTPIVGSGSTTFTITTVPGTAAGTYTITVTGTSGPTLQQSVTATLTVP
jgi:regulation of enolase protein 1 (concanavalin A-like superfamily)/fibronectin type 3 domain-containing protein